MNPEIRVFRCLEDNFGILVSLPGADAVIAIDAPDAAAIGAELDRAGWRLTHILVTHRHGDHIQGIPELKGRGGVEVIAARQAGDAVPADRRVAGGDRIAFGDIAFDVYDTPGHCADHISFHAPALKALFCGDVIFKLGCGRVMEGPYETLFASIRMLAALPDDTRVYGGHDYALSNARFAAAADPGNAAVKAALAQAEADREAGRLTAITTLAQEKRTNPFLRTGDPAVARAAGREGASEAEIFKALREWKNGFR